MSEDIITQVQPDHYAALPMGDYDDSGDYNLKIHLDIRGTPFTITRDELMGLPELILLCLFPNGVFLDINGQVIANLTEDDVVYVNFDPECFKYIATVFGEAQNELNENPLLPQVSHLTMRQENVLQNKPAIIVLREDLDFYIIPPHRGMLHLQIRHIKLEVALTLLQNKLIFLGLGFDPTLPPTVDQHLGPAEKHLFDMLCTLGFDRGGQWGIRLMEPNKCVILLLLLVRLSANHPQEPAVETPDPALSPQVLNTGDRPEAHRLRLRSRLSQIALAALRSLLRQRKLEPNYTKLLLFWRKPARKCWWLHETITVDVNGVIAGEKTTQVKVHIRRVWTLELSVVGVQ